MKKILFLILVSCIMGKTYATSILLDKSKNQLWYVTNYYVLPPMYPPCPSCPSYPVWNTEIFKLGEKDSLKGKEYYELLRTTDSSLSSWSQWGFIREDSNKVYYMPDSTVTERLRYNFNVELSSNVAFYCTNGFGLTTEEGGVLLQALIPLLQVRVKEEESG